MSRFIRIDDVLNDERSKYFTELFSGEVEFSDKTRLIGAVDDEGYPEGALAFRLSGGSVTILHVAVYPHLRRQGIGTGLIHALLDYLEPLEIPYIVEAYYSPYEDDGERSGADAFFRSIPDFEVVSGGKYCTVSSSTVWNSSRLKLLESFSCSCKPFQELDKGERSDLIKYLREKDMETLIRDNEDAIIPELSLCHTEKGKCSCMVLFKNSEIKRSLELALLVAKPGEMDALSGVLNEVIRRLKVMYPRHNLVFSLVNREAELVTKRFFTKGLMVSEISHAISFGKIG